MSEWMLYKPKNQKVSVLVAESHPESVEIAGKRIIISPGFAYVFDSSLDSGKLISLDELNMMYEPTTAPEEES